MRIWIRNIAFFSLQICGFAICGLGHRGLRICSLGINYYKFVDLRFANWHTSEICGFAIAKWAHVGAWPGPPYSRSGQETILQRPLSRCVPYCRWIILTPNRASEIMLLSQESNPSDNAGEHSMQRAVRTVLWTAIRNLGVYYYGTPKNLRFAD